ncbi:unnamed protein product [Hermetia illucens]|uniref:Ig-like domain-containing protein n=2 Tax=Hermetia illucens TaxID=343691 RepID=A0A7R8UEG1_HERIL|nr:unnamed protein product [Hermetia illucens]
MSDKLTSACPSFCICKWKGGKQTVECGDRLLSSIPEGMDAGTQVLNFSGNSLQVLQNERFLRMDLINLQKIFFARNQLIKIHERAFRGLSNLVELDLTDNMLQQVPSETFQDYTSLMRLSLSGNPIRELRSAAFRYLAFLTTLELSNCQIEKVENEAFIGMDNLEWLRLDGNRIAFIQGSHILPKSLHGINLQSNRWTCDCRLTDVHAWLINYNTPQEEEPRCLEPPRLKGQVIKSLKKDELACLPDIDPKSAYTEIVEGRNISLMCTVRAIPEATVLWLFNGQVLNNDTLLENLHMYYYIDESGGEEKRSEVFIYNVGPEDNGTFSCIGRNTAGTSFSNYTIRVLMKEMPIAKEVSFSRNYMNIIIAGGGGAGFIFILLLCTIVIKCRKKSPKNKSRKTDTATSDSGLLKCPSIINEEDMSPKTSKENGIMIGEGSMKQNFMMYVPTMPTGHMMDNGSMQLTGSSASSPPLNAGDAHGISSGNMPTQYCSPPSSLRNYQDKNPDLVNDAESVKNKLKNDSEYEGSDCSTGPCSIQGTFDNCYQLPGQFGSQIIRPTGIQARFAPPPMSTIPRGLHAKAGGQHQVDVHLNPVCFLGQDGYAYDYSNNHMHTAGPAVPMNQQNFYRTLPHNRSHNKVFASASNPGARYSLEAEFLQRTGTPTYDQYAMQNIRFTAEGYPLHPVKFPSPPEGYKTSDHVLLSGDPLNAAQSGFQQWPPCLPGYHAQPIHYSASVPPTGQVICSTPSTVISRPPSQQSQTQPQQQSLAQSTASPVQTVVTSSATQTPTTSTSTATTEVKRRCVGQQTNEMEPETIPEGDEEAEHSKLRHLAGPLADSPDEGYVGDSQESSDI